jgi:hypothetical protein
VATYRDAGQPLAGGALEELVYSGGHISESTLLPFSTLIPDPADGFTAWAVYSQFTQEPDGYIGTSPNYGVVTSMRGDAADDPSGTATLGHGGWTNAAFADIALFPLVSSPTHFFRYSAIPDTTDTGNGPMLTKGITLPSQHATTVWLSDPSIGGTPAGSTQSAWVQWQTGAGSWSTPIQLTANVDGAGPVVDGIHAAFALGTVGTTASVKYTWTATDSQSGVKESVFAVNPNWPSSLEWLVTLPPSTTSVTHAMVIGKRYSQIILQVGDKVDNYTDANWLEYVTVKAAQGTATGLSYYKTWSTQSSSSFLGSSTRYASSAGAKATYAFTGRAVALVSTKGPNRGKAEIWVDGVKAATIDLYSSSTKYRQIVWRANWDSSGSHSVVVKVLGTSGRPRVDVDAFLKF